jgi:hypothetical protein
MALWLFIGTVVCAIALMVFCCSLGRFVARRRDYIFDPTQDRAQADLMAADAARMADARTPPFHGGYPI